MCWTFFNILFKISFSAFINCNINGLLLNIHFFLFFCIFHRNFWFIDIVKRTIGLICLWGQLTDVCDMLHFLPNFFHLLRWIDSLLKKVLLEASFLRLAVAEFNVYVMKVEFAEVSIDDLQNVLCHMKRLLVSFFIKKI